MNYYWGYIQKVVGEFFLLNYAPNEDRALMLVFYMIGYDEYGYMMKF